LNGTPSSPRAPSAPLFGGTKKNGDGIKNGDDALWFFAEPIHMSVRGRCFNDRQKERDLSKDHSLTLWLRTTFWVAPVYLVTFFAMMAIVITVAPPATHDDAARVACGLVALGAAIAGIILWRRRSQRWRTAICLTPSFLLMISILLEAFARLIS